MQQLNKEQQLAVMHRDGPMLVLAGPGSGKTAVLVNRVLRLVKEEQIDPYNILVLTFSKLAAEEMRSRFISFADASYPVTFGTFHAIFYHILKRQGLYRTGEILTRNKKITLLNIIAKRLRLKCCDDREKLSRLADDIGIKKMGCLRLLEDINEEEKKELELVYDPYLKLCRTEGCIDFDDMINECLKALKLNDKILRKWQERYRYILVDEFQDIDMRQYEVLRLLAGKTENVFCVGDDDQSIYSFRGAEPAVMRRFTEDYPDVRIVELKVNYRCPNEIIDHAGKLIKNNRDRFNKEQICQDICCDGNCIDSTESEDGDARDKAAAEGLNGCIDRRKDDFIFNEGYYSESISIDEEEKSTAGKRKGRIDFKCFRTPAEEAGYCVRIINELLNSAAYESAEDESATIGILYRTSKSADVVEEMLKEKQIPYRRKDRAADFYEKDWVKDVTAYLRLAAGKRLCDNKDELFRILNRPERGLTRESLVWQKDAVESMQLLYDSVYNKPGHNESGRNESGHDESEQCESEQSESEQSESEQNAFVQYEIDSGELTRNSILDYYKYDEGSQAVCRKLFEDIDFISDMNCYAAVNYILKGIGLEEYIKEHYFKDKEKKAEDDAINELRERARGHKSITEWLKIIDSQPGEPANCESDHGKQGSKYPDIELMTIHGSKGLEFDNVIMIGLQEGIFPGKRCETVGQLEEERRLFYVAMTRTKKRLWMFGIRRDEYGKTESRFIKEAGFNCEIVGSIL